MAYKARFELAVGIPTIVFKTITINQTLTLVQAEIAFETIPKTILQHGKWSMACSVGLEPTTCSSVANCSILLSLETHNGWLDKTRTYSYQINSLVFYH